MFDLIVFWGGLAILALCIVGAVSGHRAGRPAWTPTPKKVKPARFTRQAENYRLSDHLTERITGEELSDICAEYARHGYRLTHRSGRDSMDLTFERWVT